RGLAAEDRPGALRDYVQKQVAKVLGLDPAEPLDRQQGFFDLGMDSLTAVQLCRKIATDVGKSLATAVIFTYPNVDALAEYLGKEVLGLELSRTGPAKAVVPTIGSGAGAMEEATEEELFQRLAERLTTLDS